MASLHTSAEVYTPLGEGELTVEQALCGCKAMIILASYVTSYDAAQYMVQTDKNERSSKKEAPVCCYQED
jgi:hypothetical protein